MIGRRVRIQLCVFGALTLIAVGLIAFQYARVPSLMGIGQVRATAQFSEGGGIYPFANVTYRGVTVGRVKSVTLAQNGAVDVTMSVSSDARVPADVRATIKSVSAVGEQYVDLVPRSATSKAMLKDGSVIAEKFTATPVPIAEVLDNVDTLVSTLPKQDLATTLDEADKAFSGAGPDLRSILRSTGQLVDSAQENWPETQRLIQDAQPALRSQLQTRAEIKAWTSDLAEFTTALSKNDKQVRRLLLTLPPAADQAGSLLDDLNPRVAALLDSSKVLAELGKDYNAPLKQLATVLPRLAAASIAADLPHRGGQFGLAFKTIANYPGSCSTGWPAAGEPLGSRGPNQLVDEAYPTGSYCKIPQVDPRSGRGARNLECFEPGSPPGRRAATIYQCRGNGFSDPGSLATTQGVLNPLAGNPTLDAFLGGIAPADMNRHPVVKEVTTWQELMLNPLG